MYLKIILFSSFFTTLITASEYFNTEMAKEYEFPYYVALFSGTESKLQFECGGTIIRPNWVLTAAQCVFKREAITYVKAGKRTLQVDEFLEQVSKVKSVFPHKEYLSSDNHNDLALIKIKTKFKFGDESSHTTESIDLPYDNIQIRGNATICGFGSIDPEMWDPPSFVLKSNLPVIDYLDCKHMEAGNKRIQSIDKNNFCTRTYDGNPEFCMSTIGSPIVLNDVYDNYELFGIVTTDILPCHRPPGHMTVQTKIRHYVDWIIETMKKN